MIEWTRNSRLSIKISLSLCLLRFRGRESKVQGLGFRGWGLGAVGWGLRVWVGCWEGCSMHLGYGVSAIGIEIMHIVRPFGCTKRLTPNPRM